MLLTLALWAAYPPDPNRSRRRITPKTDFAVGSIDLDLSAFELPASSAVSSGRHEFIRKIVCGRATQALTLSADGSRAAVVDRAGSIEVWDAYGGGRSEVVAALRAIRDLGREAAAALRAGDWHGLARVVDENWRQQRRLDPTISTPAVQRVEDAARAAGAWGLKATGAGAGGCLLILGPPEHVPGIRDAVRAAGASPLDAGFAVEGAQVWEDDAPDA